MSTDVSRQFNQLPYEHRIIASAVIIETQINQIRADQGKATSAHRKFMRETNDHIKNLERSLAERLAKNGTSAAPPAGTEAHLRDALGLIDRHGCTNNTSGRCWDGGRVREAEYSSDAWCDACVAADALQGISPEAGEPRG